MPTRARVRPDVPLDPFRNPSLTPTTSDHPPSIDYQRLEALGVRCGWNAFSLLLTSRFGIGRIDNFVSLVFEDGPLGDMSIRCGQSEPGVRAARAHVGHPLRPRPVEHGVWAPKPSDFESWGAKPRAGFEPRSLAGARSLLQPRSDGSSARWRSQKEPRAGFEPAGVPLCRRMRSARLCHLGAHPNLA